MSPPRAYSTRSPGTSNDVSQEDFLHLWDDCGRPTKKRHTGISYDRLPPAEASGTIATNWLVAPAARCR
jgi:hypothetical protein